MQSVLGLALLFTIGTVLFIVVCTLVAATICYVADNWDDFSDWFKAFCVVLLLYLVWCILIGGYKCTHAVTPKPPVEACQPERAF
jgi:uncharacterized membrane protein